MDYNCPDCECEECQCYPEEGEALLEESLFFNQIAKGMNCYE